jgi:hypothetical protein
VSSDPRVGTEYPALRHLVAGLVGDKHRHRYTSSAHFKMAVDQIAAMLPAWVDGLAAQSDAYDVDHQARMLQMLEGFNVAPMRGSPS